MLPPPPIALRLGEGRGPGKQRRKSCWLYPGSRVTSHSHGDLGALSLGRLHTELDVDRSPVPRDGQPEVCGAEKGAPKWAGVVCSCCVYKMGSPFEGVSRVGRVILFSHGSFFLGRSKAPWNMESQAMTSSG